MRASRSAVIATLSVLMAASWPLPTVAASPVAPEAPAVWENGPRFAASWRQMLGEWARENLSQAALEAVFDRFVQEEWAAGGSSAPGSASALEAETSRSGIPVGDLSGDGLNDVLSYAYEQGRTVFTGLRGRDGAPLWSWTSTASTYPWPFLVGDVTGDGMEDILFVGLTWNYSLVELLVLGETRHEWSFELVSGRDGVPAWSRSYAGTVTRQGINQGTNVLVLPYRSGDHDGDGVRDLVLNAFDFRASETWLYLETVWAGSSAVLYRTRAEVIAGVDGRTMGTFESDYTPGGARLVPVGDAAGSPTLDLAWEHRAATYGPFACTGYPLDEGCRFSGRSAFRVELIDGETLAPLWNHTDASVDSAYVVPAPSSASEGVRVDVEVIRFYSGFPGRRTFGLLDGPTGGSLWEREYIWYFPPQKLAEIGGTPGTDYLFADAFRDGFDVAVPLVRVDGRTGDILLQTEVVLAGTQNSRAYLYDVNAVQDLDADGAPDIVVGGLTFCCFPARPRSVFLLESGAVGGTFQSYSREGWASVQVAGDIDGSGTTDLYIAALTETEDCRSDGTLDASTLPGGAIQWSRAQPFASEWGWMDALPAGDHDGDGTPDALLVRWQSGAARIDSIDGATGSARWGFGAYLHPPTCGNDGVSHAGYSVLPVRAEPLDTTGWPRLTLADDAVALLPTAPFPFFDRVVDGLQISSNGFVKPGSNATDDGCCAGGRLPLLDGANGLVAGLWSDLDPSRCPGSARISYLSTPDRIQVAFENVAYANALCTSLPGAAAPRATFHLGLWTANGTIEIHLLRADGGYPGTTGLEAPGADVGYEVRRSARPLAQPLAWRFIQSETAPLPTAAPHDPRVEEKAYLGATGDVTRVCDDASGSQANVGGACFELLGRESNVTLTVHDSSGKEVAVFMWIVGGDGIIYGVGFCRSALIHLPREAVRLSVFVEEIRDGSRCENPGPASRGTLHASFE